MEQHVFGTPVYIFDMCRFLKHAMKIQAFYHITLSIILAVIFFKT